ncbi:Argonaute siRNA chaperone complex subunit Arb1-domain-containing protein [Exophiala viscosa]|nr:Argonaute siRNA chaperone complex subunit Arb1-domain-containing protein [Exophiala viscosa]
MIAVDLNHQHGEEDKQTPPIDGQFTSPSANGNAREGSVPGDEPADHPDDEDYGEEVDLPPPEARKKKKRKKAKPKSQRGLGKPTGFEDFFADAPMTPAQHAEEQELYDPALHFVDRVLTAIARFERTRKLVSERREILFKYLAYGSIETGPNQFQGGQDTEGMDKTQIAQTLTQARIRDDKRDLGTETSLYEVDFQGVMKGFLSRRAQDIYGFETREQVSLVTTTLERFMDYLLQHDVCPEYRTDVLATRNLCRDAQIELWDVAEATRRLPGDFNIACSTLFGGSYAQGYDGEASWRPESEAQAFVGMKPEEARQVIHFGVAGAASEDVYQTYLHAVHGDGALEVLSVWEHVGFEITRIVPPTEECKQLYTTSSQHFRPVGCVYAKPWNNPDAPPEDLTEDEKQAVSLPSTPDETEYVFFIESILQSYLRIGMKVEATIRVLNCGIMFFDEVLNVFPTFDEYVVNDMMLGWKEPRPLKGALDYVESEDDDEGDEVHSDQAEDEGPAEEVTPKQNGHGDELS